MDFLQWTREDFLAFDTRRNEVIQPTQSEIELEREERRNHMISYTNSILSKYNIQFIGNELDFSDLYAKYILGGDDYEINPDMREWLGENLQDKLNDKIENNNSLEEFCNFVMQYQ